MQKAVLRLDLHDEKDKKKAMKIASAFAGVESIDINMKDQKLTVAGAMDPVKLAEKLRRQFLTDIVSVGPAKEAPKKDDKKDNPDKKEDNESNKKGQPKESKPDPPRVDLPPPWFYRPLPPPPTPYYPGYYQPPPPSPCYCYGGYVSVEEDPNACVIC